MKQKRLSIKYKNIDELKSYDKNPRLNDEAVPLVAKSIEQFGMKVPVVIDKNNTIVCGHTRVKALKQLGETEVPCIVADDLTQDEIKAFRLADNKVAEAAGWDFGLLDEELDFLSDDFDMEDFGFILEDFESTEFSEVEEDEEDNLMEDEVQIKDKTPRFEDTEPLPDSEPAPNVWTAIEMDDKIKLGRHTLYCSNVLGEDVETYGTGFDISILTPTWEGVPSDDISDVCNKCSDVSGVTAICSPWGAAPSRLCALIYKAWPDQFAYWQTNEPMPVADRGVIASQVHPIPLYIKDQNSKLPVDVNGWNGIIKGVLPSTMSSLPLYVATELIERLTPENGSVFAPFGGTGTVLISCEDTGRSCTIVESDPAVCETIARRYIERVGSSKGVELIRHGVLMDYEWE